MTKGRYSLLGSASITLLFIFAPVSCISEIDSGVAVSPQTRPSATTSRGSIAPAFVSAAAATAATSQPIVEGTLTCTARGGGTWRVFFNAAGAQIVAANADAIWFEKGANIWRYNVRARAVDVCTSPLTHQQLEYNNYFSLADNGQFAIGTRAANYLWDPKDGWSRLPQPNSNRVTFDPAGKLWAVCERAAAWEKGAWTESRAVPQYSGAFACGDGFFSFASRDFCTPQSGRKGENYAWFDKDFQKHTPYPIELDKYYFRDFWFRAGKDSFGLFYLPGGKNGFEGKHAVCRVTPDSFEELVQSQLVVLDLARGGGLAVVPQGKGSELSLRVEDAAGKKVTEFAPPPGFVDSPSARYIFYRDANGDYWHNCYRWDGKVWKPVVPADALVFEGNMREAVFSGRLRLDDKGKTWTDALPHVPPNVRAYNPKTGAGWLMHDVADYSYPQVWDEYQFSRESAPKRLGSITVPQGSPYLAEPNFVDTRGNLWVGNRCCWDGKVMRGYDNGWHGANSEKEVFPAILADPEGDVWMYYTRRTWKKFDADKKQFTDASPFESFAFTHAGKSYAVMGTSPAQWSFGDLGVIYVKEGHAWGPMKDVLMNGQMVGRGGGAGTMTYFGWPGRMCRKDCMLVSGRMGVFEWDAKADRWSYLLPYKDVDAGYDDAGRRIMMTEANIGRIFVYDGPTMADAPVAEPPPEIARLLVRLDDNAWRVRDEATRELVNMARKNSAGIRDALLKAKAAGGLSLEVSSRIETVLAEVSGVVSEVVSWEGSYTLWRRRVGSSLFERMSHPLTATFPGGYVIKPGMSCELARSILQVCGATYSMDIQYARGGDMTYQGYLLRDNTMVYLRVTKAAPQKIVSLGLGEFAKGNDKEWPWDDARKMGLKSVDLAPCTATMAE